MMTIAIQRARPTMISPVRYSGRSGSNSHARANISSGPRTQFNTSELTTSRRSPRTVTRPVVADLRQHRVHHEQQADRDRQTDPVYLHPL